MNKPKIDIKKAFKNTIFVRSVWVLGVFLLIFLLSQGINFNDYQNLIGLTSIPFILLFLALSVLVQFFKAVSYYLLLNEAGINLSLLRTTRVFFASQMTTFLPGGEVGRILLTKAEFKSENEKIASTVMAQALVEIISAIIVVLLGSFYFETFRLPSLFALLILIVVLSIIFSKRIWKIVTKLPLKIKLLSKYETPIINFQGFIRTQVFLSDSYKINYSLLKVLLCAFISHFIGGLLIYSISFAYGLNLNLFQSIFAFSLSVLIQGFITIIPGGLGITDGGLIALLVLLGNSLNKSVFLTLTFRIAGFFFNIIIGSIVFLIFYRHGFKSPKSKGKK